MGLKKSNMFGYKKWNKKEVLYLKKNYKNKSIQKLSMELNRSWCSIYHKANKIGLIKLPLPKADVLKKLYIDKKLSTKKIAKIYNVTPRAVSTKLKRARVTIRNLSDAQELIANHIKINKIMNHYFDGLLLGDGCVTTPKKNNKSGVYTHADKHLSYIIWLKKQFSKFQIRNSKTYHNKKLNTYSFKTKYYREFIAFRQRWYPNGKKVIPKDLILMPITLKNWYLGDGSYKLGINGTKSAERVMLCSEFDPFGRKLIAEQLINLGIDCSIYPNGIYIKAKSRPKFFEYMLSDDNEIPGCYKYKFPQEILNGAQ